jgi:hypothetical protein
MKKFNQILYKKYFQPLMMIGKANILKELNRIIALRNAYYAVGKKRKIFLAI